MNRKGSAPVIVSLLIATVLIVGGVWYFIAHQPSLAQVPAPTPTNQWFPAAHTNGNLLCDNQGIICVSSSTKNSAIPNPMNLDVQINSTSSQNELDWTITNGAGQTIGYGVYVGTSSLPHLQAFFAEPAQSVTGTLTLTFYGITSDFYDPNAPSSTFTVPIKLNVATTSVTILAPQNFQEDGQPISFASQKIEVMRVNGDDPIEETAVATVKAMAGGQGSDLYMESFHLENGIATVMLALPNGGWAGYSIWANGIAPTIEKNLLQFPSVKKVVVVWDNM
jgi:hypothetical protein